MSNPKLRTSRKKRAVPKPFMLVNKGKLLSERMKKVGDVAMKLESETQPPTKRRKVKPQQPQDEPEYELDYFILKTEQIRERQGTRILARSLRKWRQRWFRRAADRVDCRSIRNLPQLSFDFLQSIARLKQTKRHRAKPPLLTGVPS